MLEHPHQSNLIKYFKTTCSVLFGSAVICSCAEQLEGGMLFILQKTEFNQDLRTQGKKWDPAVIFHFLQYPFLSTLLLLSG